MVADTLGSDVSGRMLAVMAEGVLPTGTVTFLFSDMEGSTRLVQDLGPAVFTEVIERHNAVLRDAFGRHGGTERWTQGDSFLVMFLGAPAAVAAAADAQRALAGTLNGRRPSGSSCVWGSTPGLPGWAATITSESTSTVPRGSPASVMAARSCSRMRHVR